MITVSLKQYAPPEHYKGNASRIKDQCYYKKPDIKVFKSVQNCTEIAPVSVDKQGKKCKADKYSNKIE